MSIQKITDQEVRSLWIQRLSDTPNRAGRYGTPGLTAAEVKAAYDALSLRIVEAYNALVDAIENGKLAENLPVLDGKTLSEVLSEIKSGALASYLSVDGFRALSSLAAEFDTHTHPTYAPLAGKEDQPFAVGAPKDGADALPLAFADARYFSNFSIEYDQKSRRLRAVAERQGDRVLSEVFLPNEEDLLEKCNAYMEKIAASLENLRLSALGVTFETVNVSNAGYAYTFEEGSLPTAQLKRLGGYTSHTPDGSFWNKAPKGFKVTDITGTVFENAEDALAPVKRLFPDFPYGISPKLCNYYDFESGLYHRNVLPETYPRPLNGTGTIYGTPVLEKETSSFYIFNQILGGRKPTIPKIKEALLFCSQYFKAATSTDVLYKQTEEPLVSLYGESSGYRCLKWRVPKQNDMGITADPQTLQAFFADKSILLLLPYTEESFSVAEALRAEGSEETLPDGLIRVEAGQKVVFGQVGYTVCYELEYDKKTKGEAV